MRVREVRTQDSTTDHRGEPSLHFRACAGRNGHRHIHSDAIAGVFMSIFERELGDA